MSQLRPGPMYCGTKPIRDADYKRFIKKLPCIGCGKNWGIDPMHTGPHGLNQKASDLDVLPGCRRCHDEFDANPRQFAEHHKLNIPALIQRFNQFYQTKLKGRAA